VEGVVEGVVVLLVVLAVATAFGLWRRRVDGRLTTTSGGATEGATLTADELGHELGASVTFVQFSTAFCQPCRANRQVLSHLAGTDEGVVHIDIDAESHLDLVRRLDVTRTPTTFVLDPSGVIRRRATGALRLDEARSAAATIASL
jgi:thiol-disulfide isomerase/thioredoxin